MAQDFASALDALVRRAPHDWLTSTCYALRCLPASAAADYALQSVPTTNNADLSFLMREIIGVASSRMSWEALSWAIETTSAIYHRCRAEQELELLWSGPSPAGQIPARRIDQALYDLIANANREILLVTFAASRINRLAGELMKAARRGVQVRLVLEFEQSSEGQLSYDALRAFPAELVSAVKVYHWPIENRERNQAGRPGKLHAKVAIIDDTMLVSSANLTDDAFNRNFEVGVMIKDRDLLSTTRGYFEALIADGILNLLAS